MPSGTGSSTTVPIPTRASARTYGHKPDHTISTDARTGPDGGAALGEITAKVAAGPGLEGGPRSPIISGARGIAHKTWQHREAVAAERKKECGALQWRI